MGLLNAILGIFGSDKDPQAAKKKRLRHIAKALSQNKYNKFYRVKTEELEPAFAKCFHTIYKVTASAQVLLQNAAKSAELKQITMDYFLDKDLRDLKENLNAAAIQEKAKSVPVKDLSAAVRRDMANYMAAFDNVRISDIDNCYNTIISLVNFVSFDYYFFLKKFDPEITERNFTYQPKFVNVKVSDAAEEIKDFMEILAAVIMDWEWKSALAVLKIYKDGMDVVNAEQWAKIIRLLKELYKAGTFELIIQHASNDPLWQSIPRIPCERMADTILDAKKAEIEGAINKIQNDRRSAQIEQLTKMIFGNAEVSRLSNYTDKGNDIFYKRNFTGFTKTAGINYLKAYLLDYFKKEIKELCDLILVRGQWSNIALSQPISDAYHEMMGFQEKITVFDESLGEKGEHGTRLRQALVKLDRDKGQSKNIKIILKNINNTAQRMINSASAAFITIGKTFKTLLEDMQKKHPEIIMNWRELESSSDIHLSKRITDDYKKMYYFVQLLQFYTGPLEEEDGPPNQG